LGNNSHSPRRSHGAFSHSSGAGEFHFQLFREFYHWLQRFPVERTGIREKSRFAASVAQNVKMSCLRYLSTLTLIATLPSRSCSCFHYSGIQQRKLDSLRYPFDFLWLIQPAHLSENRCNIRRPSGLQKDRCSSGSIGHRFSPIDILYELLLTFCTKSLILRPLIYRTSIREEL
jgi:hypothetical protein